MTHSHDTSTPAMSAETVPSEERPTVNEYAANYYFAGDGGDYTPTEGERVMIEDAINGYLAEAAALALSASHLAKEGGEEGAVERKEAELALKEATALAVSLFNQHYRSNESYASGDVVWKPLDDIRGVISQIDNMTAGLSRSLPQPSPALAKGGDAVRERVARIIMKDRNDDAQAQQVGAATPTEGPASQTEGMGGDALTHYARTLAKALREKHYPHLTNWVPFDDLAGLLTQIDNMTAGLVRPAALTPPETAEAVPVAETSEAREIIAAVDFYDRVMASADEERIAVGTDHWTRLLAACRAFAARSTSSKGGK